MGQAGQVSADLDAREATKTARYLHRYAYGEMTRQRIIREANKRTSVTLARGNAKPKPKPVEAGPLNPALDPLCDLWGQRHCFVCGSLLHCCHREPEVELAIIEGIEKRRARITGKRKRAA